MKSLLLTRFVSACCLLLGAAVLLAPRNGALRGITPLLDDVSPKSALIIIFAALALLVAERKSSWAIRVRLGLGAAIVSLAAITLGQQSLGIFPNLSPWPWGLFFSLDPGADRGAEASALHFANMAGVAAIGFVLYGIALILLGHLKNAAVLWMVHVLCALCFTLALAVEMIHLMGVSFLLEGEATASGQMGWPTATALLLLSVGLYFSASRGDAVRAYYVRYEDHKIIGLTTFLLLVTAVGAGLAGAGILLHQSYEVSQQTLKQAQASKAVLFHDTLIAAQNQALRVARLVSELQPDQLGPLFFGLNDSHQGGEGAQKNYELAALEILGDDGNRIVALGDLGLVETARVALRDPPDTWLVWRDGWLLESHSPVKRQDGFSGKVVTHIRLHRVEQLLDQARGLGRTGAVVVCAPYDAATMQCLPSRQNPQQGRMNLRREGKPLPMALALAGKEGIAVAYDNYGVNVISAYGPIGGTGLGMAQKIETSELYAPLRKRLWWVIAAVLGLTLAGAALLWRLIHPLTARLLETRAYLLGLTNSIPEAVITTDERGEIKTCNPAATALFGYGVPELRTRKIDALFAPEPAHTESGPLLDDNGRMRSTGKAALKLLGGKKDGAAFPAELTVTEFNREGKRRFVAVVRDVSARQAGEEALHRSEEMFRALVENAPDVIIRIDRAHRRVYANPAFESVTGLTRQAVLGKTHEESGLAERLSLDWYGTVDQVFETGQDKTIDFTLQDPAGPKYLQVRFVPERARDGSVQSVLALGRDITAAKRAETVLRESGDRLRRITGHMPGMVFQLVRTPSGTGPTFSYVSEGASALCGLSSETVLADAPRFLDLIFDEDRPLFDRSMDHSAGDLYPWNWEGRIRAGSFGETWVSLRATPMRLLDGSVVWDGIILNITQTKLNELELRQSRESMRLLTAHREAVREEERKHIAREIHDELGQLLTALRMEVATVGMEFGRDNPELAGKVQSMKKIINQTIQTVRQVATSLRPAALDLGIESAIEWLASGFCKRNAVECAVVIPGEIVLDEERATALFRILQETLTNIARHAAATAVSITLKTTGEQLCLKVTDNGRGFDPDEAKRGSSFGLKGMAERVVMLAGTMAIESAPGRGTTLSVCIPIAETAGKPKGVERE